MKPVQRWIFLGMLFVMMVFFLSWYMTMWRSITVVDENDREEETVKRRFGSLDISPESVSVTMGHSEHEHTTATESISTKVTSKMTSALLTETTALLKTKAKTPAIVKTLAPPGRGWDSGSFCDTFLHRTFQEIVPVCAAKGTKHSSITCRRTPLSTRMVECSISNVLVRPQKLYSAMTSDHIPNSNAIELLDSDETECISPDTNKLHRTTEGGDHVRLMVEESLKQSSHPKRSDCKRWVNETTVMFQGNNVHVYFEVLVWFNAFKVLMDQGMQEPYKVMRVAAHNFQYLFGDYEKLLFPGIEFVHDILEETVCFRKLILPPGCFASLLFRCKMEADVRGKCFSCNGKDRPSTAISIFRSQALKACSLDDSTYNSGYRNPQRIVVILRKQYNRHPADKPENFRRAISNSQQLIEELRKIVPNVDSFHGEDLSMCEQIKLTHSADIFIGVHGAGLVHAWWLRDSALLFELVPSDQLGNPTFHMLTTLAGRNYKGYHLNQMGSASITVNIKDIVSTLANIIHNGL